MLRQSENLKKVSTLIFVLFILSVTTALILGHVFRAPPMTGKENGQYALLFTDEDLQGISNILFKNQLGSFQLEKKGPNWALKYPKQAEVEPSFVEGLLETLKTIKIKKTMKPDPINMANFSLTTPLVEIVLIKDGGERKIIRMGLINPVDNSTYLSLSDQNLIYHIDALKTSLNALNLSDLTESKVFSFNKGQLLSFKIFKGDQKLSKTLLAFSKNREGWGSREGSILNEKKVDAYLEKILSLKSLPLNSPNTELLKKIEEAQGEILYTLELEGEDQKIVSYRFFLLEKPIEGIDLKEKSLAIIRASNKEFPNIITRDFLDLLEKTEKDF